MKQRYERWQVILGVILFFMLMGVVGTIDRNSQQAPPVYYNQYAGGGR